MKYLCFYKYHDYSDTAAAAEIVDGVLLMKQETLEKINSLDDEVIAVTNISRPRKRSIRPTISFVHGAWSIIVWYMF